MPTLEEHFKDIVNNAKLKSAITFTQGPLINFVNEHRNRYLKLHALEGKPDSFYNPDPLCEIISDRIKDSFLLGSTHSGIFLEIENLSTPKRKGSIGGLCEILCDWVIKNDYLRNSIAFSTIFTDQKKELTADEQKKLLDSFSSDASFFRRERWSREKLSYERHGYYPKDYVSYEDHKRIMTQDETTGKYKINNEVLSKSLDKVKHGYYATLYFTRPSDTGHAMLIRRNSNKSFTFFDPNYIALFDITKEEVSNVIAKILEVLYSTVSFHDVGIIERKKGISENLATDNKPIAKSAKGEVRSLLENPNISMLTYKQLEG